MPKICRFTADGRYTAKVDAAAETLTADNPMGMPLEDMSRVYVGDVDIDTHYHDLATGQPVLMPTRPSLDHQFDYGTKTWIDPRTLQDFKDAKWAQIKAARDTAEFGTLTWDGSVFDVDAPSQARIRPAADRARRDPTTAIEWTLANNTKRLLTATQLAALGDALDMHVAAVHAVASALREQINAATTAAQLNLIHWI